MTVRTMVGGSSITVVVAWLVWIAIVVWLDPVQAGWIGFLLFFLTLFAATASTSALIGYAMRRLIFPHQFPAHSARPALRQGIWVALFTSVLLGLQLLRFTRWWLTLLLIIFFLSLELLFLSYDRTIQRPAKPAPARGAQPSSGSTQRSRA